MPGVEVSSDPVPPLAPLESVHEEIPGPLAPSEHENAVATDCPTAYVP